MLKHWLLFFVCLLVGALGENVISSVSYTLSRPNAKNFVYIDQSTHLSVTVSVASFEKDDSLRMYFTTAEDTNYLSVYPTSACRTADGTPVFAFDGKYINAVSKISTATTCTFSGYVRANIASIVYSRLGFDANFYPVSPFSTANSSFEAAWADSIYRVGEATALSVNGNIRFAAKDSFTITASNGSPFTSASHCLNKDDVALFSVSAQGNRLLFSTRANITSDFSCSIQVVLGPTTASERPYIFAAAEYGILRESVQPVLTLLDNGDFHTRMGLVGAMVSVGGGDNKVASVPDAVPEAEVAGTAGAIPAAVDVAAAPRTAASQAADSTSTPVSGPTSTPKRRTFASATSARKIEREARRVAKAARKTGGKRVRRSKAERQAAVAKGKKFLASSAAKSSMRAAAVGAGGTSTTDFDNAMYIGIPASTVHVGDTIKLYFNDFEGITLGKCTRKDGTVVGQPELAIEEIEATNSWLTASITLTGALQVTADKYAELHCHFTITQPDDYDLGITAVGVRNGVFAAVPFEDGNYYLEEHDFFAAQASVMLIAYTPNFALLDLKMRLGHTDNYNYFNTDLSIRGLPVTDLASLAEKCVFESDEDQGDQLYSFPGVSVADGVVHLKMDLATLLILGGWANLRCGPSLPVGTTVTVFDNAVNKPLISDTVHEGNLRITYGDNVHTHFMAHDAVNIPPAIPFSLDASNLYVQAGVDAGYAHTGLDIYISGIQIYHAQSFIQSGAFTLDCSKGNVAGYSYAQGGWNYDYTYLSFSLTGFDAKCTGFAAALPPKEKPVYVSSQGVVIYMRNSGSISHYVSFPNAVPLTVTMPRIISKELFSFRHNSFDGTTSQTTTFSVGHTLLAKDASFTLEFDHDVVAVGSTCTAGYPTTDILTCTHAADKRSITCVKVNADVADACSLSITFASDFARTISVTASFTGLPEGMVFAPKFSIAMKKASTSMSGSDAFLGRDMFVTVNLPRSARTTDVLQFAVDVDDVNGLEFSHFEPSLGDTSGVAIVNATTITVPLTLLNTATTTNAVKVYFRHILSTTDVKPYDTHLSVYANDVSLGDLTINVKTSPSTITRVPSAVPSLYNVVALKHTGMSPDDIITFNYLTLGADAVLLCDDAEPITINGNSFIFTSTVEAGQACYALFSAYTLQKPYWSVTFTVAGVATTVRVKATTAEGPFLSAVPSDNVYIKDIATTLDLEIRDFTTGFITEDSNISFSYDTAIMSVQKVECPLVSGKAEGTITGGTVTIPMTPTDIPRSSMRNLICKLSFTPLASAANPELTTVSVLGEFVPRVVLPAFQGGYVPSLTVDVSDSAIRVFNGTHMEIKFHFRQMATTVGDTITLIHSLPSDILNITSCTNAVKVSNDEISITTAVSDVIPVKTVTCYGDVRYVSETPVPITVRYTSGEVFTDFNVVLPPSYAYRVSLDLVSQEVGKLTYRLTRRETHVATKTPDDETREIYLTGAYNSNTMRMETDCPIDYGGTSYFYLYIDIAKGMDQYTCLVTLWMDEPYIPIFGSDNIAIVYNTIQPDNYVYEYVPAVKSAKPFLTAYVDTASTMFYFANADANTITFTNMWKLQANATHPVAIRSLADGTEVGKIVSSADGTLLTGSFNTGAVIVENGKYNLNMPYYFNTTGIHGAPLFSTYDIVRISIGSLTYLTQSEDINTPKLELVDVDTTITPGSPFAVSLGFAIVGNTADFSMDYNNTALASVQACYGLKNLSSAEMTVPLTVKAKGPSLSITLSETNTLKSESSAVFGLRCVFNTFSEAEVQKKAATFTNTLSVKMVTPDGSRLFGKTLSVPAPHLVPKTALTHSASFPRSTLFNSTEIASLVKTYAAGLRSVVAALKDSQVAVSSQRLHRPTAPAAVPNPITSLLAVNSADDGTVAIVAFTITPTDDVPITTNDIDTGSIAVVEAFITAGHGAVTLDTPDETVVDGACDFRCGLGCSLCVEGATCSASTDCIDGNCNSNNVCGPEPERDEDPEDPEDPDNAAPTATISLAVLAIVAASLLF